MEYLTVGLRLIAELARLVIDDTDFDLTETSTYDWPNDSMASSTRIGNTFMFGLTSTHDGNHQRSPYFYKIIWLNDNDNLTYTTSAVCSIFQNRVSAHYILNHEFGHLAGLSHHNWWPLDSTHTAMKTGCNSGQAEIRAEDINDINDYYE